MGRSKPEGLGVMSSRLRKSWESSIMAEGPRSGVTKLKPSAYQPHETSSTGSPGFSDASVSGVEVSILSEDAFQPLVFLPENAQTGAIVLPTQRPRMLV